MSLKASRYRTLESELTGQDGVQKVEMDEDWIPPHKMAGFTPYDAIVTLEDTDEVSWTEEDARGLLEESGVNYDEFLSFEPNPGGVYEVFISLSD